MRYIETELLSIIVPIYNSEQYLNQCLESLLNQTYKNIEIVLVDDGSVDESGKICDEYAKRDMRIVVIHQKNSGVVFARRRGVENAKGNLIMFVDSDDWVESDLVQILMTEIMRENADMVAASMTVVDKEGNLKIQTSAIERGVYNKGEIEKYIFPRMVYDDIAKRPGIFACFVGKILQRKQLLEDISGLDTRLTYGEDGAVIFPYLMKVNKLVVSDCSRYYYVQHDTSMANSFSLEAFHKVTYLEEYLISKIKKTGKYELVEKQIHYYIRDWLFRIIKSQYDVDCGRILCVPPYELIPKDSRLVIYGAGKAGKEFVRLLLQNHYAEVTAWVDQNFGWELYSYQIERPESIQDKEYDYVLIALTDEKTVYEVKEYLHSIGVEEKKILWKEINWG